MRIGTKPPSQTYLIEWALDQFKALQYKTYLIYSFLALAKIKTTFNFNGG